MGCALYVVNVCHMVQTTALAAARGWTVVKMDEYIKREAALSLVRPDAPEDEKAAVTIATAKKLVRNIVWRTPAADVEPKREPAVWVRYSTTMMECSRCGRHTARHRFEYCPHCGAPMRERKEE